MRISWLQFKARDGRRGGKEESENFHRCCDMMKKDKEKVEPPPKPPPKRPLPVKPKVIMPKKGNSSVNIDNNHRPNDPQSTSSSSKSTKAVEHHHKSKFTFIKNRTHVLFTNLFSVSISTSSHLDDLSYFFPWVVIIITFLHHEAYVQLPPSDNYSCLYYLLQLFISFDLFPSAHS